MHNGGTGGYRSFMGYDPETKVGVVALSNTSSTAGVDDIGRHLLEPTYPLLKIAAPKEHKEVEIDKKLFDEYVGRYQLAPSFIITVSQSDGRLFAQATGQRQIEVFAEGPRDFFYKVVDAQLTFEVGPDGKAISLVLHQNGRSASAKRIE